jgi:hypothetical protein
MTKTSLEFRNWGPARRVGSPSEARTILVIVICLIFDICDLEFIFLQYSSKKAISCREWFFHSVGSRATSRASGMARTR